MKQKSVEHPGTYRLEFPPEALVDLDLLALLWQCSREDAVHRAIEHAAIKQAEQERLGRREA